MDWHRDERWIGTETVCHRGTVRHSQAKELTNTHVCVRVRVRVRVRAVAGRHALRRQTRPGSRERPEACVLQHPHQVEEGLRGAQEQTF